VNFQISITIYMIVSAILVLVVVGIVLFLALVVFNLVVTVIGALRANTGEAYRYPLSIRFVK
jgi:uncharacterized Tic20 family protein